MSKAGKTRVRRLRRQNAQALKNGWGAKPKHKGRSGRTGGMHEKQLQAMKHESLKRQKKQSPAGLSAGPARETVDLALQV